MKGLRITFLLPGPGHLPTGGAKVVYEYANYLSRRGHRVTLVHPALKTAQASHLQRLKGALSFLHRGTTRDYVPSRWFQLEPAVHTSWVPALSSRYIPDADAVVATAWATAESIVNYPSSKGVKFYLIQSWETWDGPEERVRATWTKPLKRIVIARWLQEIAHELGVECAYIPNGIDCEQFGLDRSIESRDPHHAMMLYHLHPVKGSADGLAALMLVKNQEPGLRVTMFSASPQPANLPDWVEYYRRPSQQRLRDSYNRAAIFVSPGRIEGWPLPPAEAMLCGAALAATDIGGHREYAVHGQTALLSPVQNPEKLAENVLRLMRNDDLRISIARKGNECIRKYTWDEAVDSFERLMHRSHQPELKINPALAPAINSGPLCD